MRKIDWNRVPPRPRMAMLTSEAVGREYEIHMADFRDTHALYHGGLGRFVGLCEDGAMRLGRGPIELVDGIWLLFEDDVVGASNRDIPAIELSLAIIGPENPGRGK